jgi:outer membrane protein insertion porin family
MKAFVVRRCSFVVFIVFCALLPAQTRQSRKSTAKTTAAPSDPSKWPLESFSVKGNSHYTREQIFAETGLKLGQPVTKADFDGARDRLVASGAFISVNCGYDPAKDGKGYAATIEVAEVPELYPLHVEDVPVTDAEFLEFVKPKDALAGPKIPGTKEAVARYKDYLTELLASKNYKEPIAGTLTSENPPELIVLFRPLAPRLNVSRVKFTGAAAIPTPTLQNKLAEVASGVPYNETTFRVLLDNNIRPLYEAIGRMRVSFTKIATEPDPNVKGVAVSVEVVEGPVYKLGKVQVAGAGERQSEMLKLADLKSGETANFDQVKAASQRMEKSFHRSGYLQVSSESERHYDDTAKTVDVTIRIHLGPQFMFTKLNVIGLDIETEPTIRKMWGLPEGKPFNEDYPQHFLSRVKEDGVFDNLKNSRFENKVDQDGHTVEVTLYFNEKLTDEELKKEKEKEKEKERRRF